MSSRQEDELVTPPPGRQADACDCDGCWACAGRLEGCTCNVDWDEVYA